MSSLFVTALCGDLLAVVHDTVIRQSRLTVPLYQASTSVLQSTLTCSVGEDQDVKLEKLIFGSSTHLCALLSDNRIVVWNVTRGVVVHTLQGETFLDVAASADANNNLFLYALITKKEKSYVLEYNLESGKCVRKIKCGSMDSESKSARGLAISKEHVAVRNGKVIRILSLATGSKVGKCKLDHDGSTTTHGGGDTVFSKDGKVLGTLTGTGIALYQTDTHQHVGNLYLSQPITRLHIWANNNGDEYVILVEASSESALYIYKSSEASKSMTIAPSCPIVSPDTKLSLHPMADKTQDRLVVVLHDRNVTQVQQVLYRKGTELLETIVISNKKEEETSQSQESNKKRNVKSSVTTTLGPGQAGGESLQLSDRPVKKAKTTMDISSKEDDALAASSSSDKDQSIAERLQRLTEELEREHDDDDNDEQDKKAAVVVPSSPSSTKKPKPDFIAKRATTESLSNVLRQALRSGDDGMLELALGVRDTKIIQLTLQGLEPELVSILLTKLTVRLATKPSRADILATWLQMVLMSGKVREVHQLLPLRNLLQERVTSFPHLLRLEGRLSMLGPSTL